MLINKYTVEIFRSNGQVGGLKNIVNAVGIKIYKIRFKSLMASFLTGVIISVYLSGPVLASDIETILIISIDALHPGAINSKTSINIQHLMAQGAYTLNGQSTRPPLTLLAHAAMFSGKGPGTGGRTKNTWHAGQPGIQDDTLFNSLKSRGYSTGFFYSKEKLGYLINQAVDQHKLSKDFSIETAEDFFKTAGEKTVCFLHVSGLDRTGPVEGWMSQAYMEELFFIDQAIAPLIQMVKSKGHYLIIITSDHAGHGIVHGSDHPDDARLPLILVSDRVHLKQYQDIPYHVTELKPILEAIITSPTKAISFPGED